MFIFGWIISSASSVCEVMDFVMVNKNCLYTCYSMSWMTAMYADAKHLARRITANDLASLK